MRGHTASEAQFFDLPRSSAFDARQCWIARARHSTSTRLQPARHGRVCGLQGRSRRAPHSLCVAPSIARRAVAHAATSSSGPPRDTHPLRHAARVRSILTLCVCLWDEAVCSAGHCRCASLRIRCREALLVCKPRRGHIHSHNKHIRELRPSCVHAWTLPTPRARQSGHAAAGSAQPRSAGRPRSITQQRQSRKSTPIARTRVARTSWRTWTRETCPSA